MATYPTAVKSFTSKVDRVDDVDASDLNTAYDEISAVQSAIGVTPATSVANLATAWIGTTAFNWGTVRARLDNIERGVRGDAHGSLYVHQSGGDTVQTFDTSVIPLTLRCALNPAVNLFQVQDGNGVNRVHVDDTNMQLHQTDNVVPYITKCGTLSLTINSGSSSASGSISFADFTVTPIIMATINSTDGTLGLAGTLVYGITTTAATISINLASAVNTSTSVRLFWLAVQGLRTGSTAAIP